MIRRLAPLALVPAAAFAVHQLRYWLAFGGGAGAQLRVQGHSYLQSLVPWIVLLLAFAAGLFLRAIGRAFRGDCSLPRYTVSFAGLWLLCAGALFAIYCAQESLEGLLAAGHPAAVAGIFGYGGWWAIPASAAVGLVLAATFHGARWVLNEVALRHRRRRSPLPKAPSVHLPDTFLPPALAPLAEGWSGRGPPS